MLIYKGYIGHVEFDDEADIFHGEVINTRDVITFQGKTVAKIKKAFRESVNDYLAFCKERNEEPEKPFSGKFNLRLDPELHRQVYIAARAHKISLNQWIAEAINHHIQE
ncbi:MAG: antitoxin HicB [Gammaproteobacteria bacterium RIFCSPHIGHO2_12_FULL_45_12]|nr:MAG: antitoxin HicB [Gammaproteobacteria bacterium RIFCSPHIGHO2_12_FULL_45_12]